MLSLWLIYILFAVVISTSFQFGYQTGVMNESKTFISELVSQRLNVSDEHPYVSAITSLCVSGFLIGGLVGALTSGILANKLGRKKSVLLMLVPCFFGSLMLMTFQVAHSFEMIIIGRLLIGLACGVLTGIGPMYMSEISPLSVRGAIGVLNQMVIVTSLVLSQVLALPTLLGTQNTWPYLLGLNIVPCVIGFVLMFFCPESPRYLYLIKRDPLSARKELERLRGSEADLEDELHTLLNESQSQTEKTNIMDLFRIPYLRTAVLVAVFAQMGQQLSGMNGLLYYSTELFKASGLDKNQSIYATIGIGAVLLSVTVISIFVIDRVGRRPLLLGGLIVALCCLIIFTCSMAGKQYGQVHWLIYVALISIYVFVCGFAIGPGSIPWFIVAELFSQETRDTAVSVAITVNWVCNIIVGLSFVQLVKYCGIYSFIPFIAILVVVITVLYLYLPETLNRSIDDIQADLLRRSRSPWSGPSDVDFFPATSYSEVALVEDTSLDQG